MIWAETSRLTDHGAIFGYSPRTATADDVVRAEVAVEGGGFFAEVADDRGVLEEPVAVCFAAGAVAGFVGFVAVFAVVLDAFAGDAAGKDAEVVEVPG